MQTQGYLFILAAKPSGFVLFYFLFCFRELPLYIQCQAAWIDRFNFCYSPGYSNNPYISCNYHPAFHLQLYNGLSLCIFNHPLITSSSPNGCCLISKQIITQVPDTGSCTARVSLTTHLQSAANARCLSWNKLSRNRWTPRAVHMGVCTRVCVCWETRVKQFCLLLSQGSFVPSHFLSGMTTIPSTREEGLVHPQGVKKWASCSACAAREDFVSGWRGVCVCVSLVLLFLNIIKWEAVTTNTMSGKNYWLRPKYSIWCTMTTQFNKRWACNNRRRYSHK